MNLSIQSNRMTPQVPRAMSGSPSAEPASDHYEPGQSGQSDLAQLRRLVLSSRSHYLLDSSQKGLYQELQQTLGGERAVAEFVCRPGMDSAQFCHGFGAALGLAPESGRDLDHYDLADALSANKTPRVIFITNPHLLSAEVQCQADSLLENHARNLQTVALADVPAFVKGGTQFPSLFLKPITS